MTTVLNWFEPAAKKRCGLFRTISYNQQHHYKPEGKSREERHESPLKKSVYTALRFENRMVFEQLAKLLEIIANISGELCNLTPVQIALVKSVG